MKHNYNNSPSSTLIQSRLSLALAVGLSVLFTLCACTEKADNKTATTPNKTSDKATTTTKPIAISNDQALSDSNALYLLAGSELQDIEPFLGDIKAKTGVTLKLDYTGTIDGAEAIAQGKKVDGAWFSHGKYLSLINGKQIITQTPIMLSPVVLGVKQSKAQQLGWVGADGKTAKPDLTWQSIADKASTGELKYAMTNPASSNSGFTGLMGVVSALAGTSDAPTEADIAKARPKLKAFFNGQALTAGSSGWLADAYVKNQQTANSNLDGMINYESVLLQLNQSGKLKEPFVLLYPKEGIVTADYPLMLINGGKKGAYDKVVEYLKSPEFQTKLMNQTFRRPVNTQITLSPLFNQNMLVELPFPNSQGVVEHILATYMNDLRLPARPIFILDTSGSMNGNGMAQLKQALNTLNEGDGTTMGNFAKFSNREQITFIPFNSAPETPQRFSMDTAQTSREPIRQFVTGLEPLGGTAIYSSLHKAYADLQNVKSQGNDSGHYDTIVLMTDGRNTNGESFVEFQQFYNSLPDNVKSVKTFTVLFGEADPKEMQKIADLTGGKVFDGRTDSLASVFKQIRGYQ